MAEMLICTHSDCKHKKGCPHAKEHVYDIACDSFCRFVGLDVCCKPVQYCPECSRVLVDNKCPANCNNNPSK